VELAEQAIPAVRATVNGASGRFEIDSGNNGAMVLTAAFSDAHGIAAAYHASRTSQFTGVGGTVRTVFIRVASVSIGDVSLHGLASDVSPAKNSAFQQDQLDGAFGYDVLRRFAVTVDYPQNRLYLQPNAGFDTYNPQLGTGIAVQRTDAGTFVITRVEPGSPAARAGIVGGDTIVAIDGQSAADLSTGAYHDLVGATPGKGTTFTLLSKDGTRRDVTVRPVDMLPPAT